MAVGGKPFGWGLKPQLPVIAWGNPLARGLVFDANFHQRAPGIITDLASKTILTPASDVSAMTGPYGAELSFKTITYAAKYAGATPAAVNSLTTLSIECLYFPRNALSTTNYLLVKRQGESWIPGSTYFYIVDNRTDGVVHLYSDWATTQGRWALSNVTVGRWHHVVITYNYAATSDDPLGYLNGIPVTVDEWTAPSGSKGTDAATVAIGGDQTGGGRAGDFEISYIRIWNRILSPYEARSLYENPWRIYKQASAPLFGYKKPLSLIHSPYHQQHLLVR
jgi:hypothetical protein